jgi:ATP-binding cassette, subfamily A (ABC1), member 3
LFYVSAIFDKTFQDALFEFCSPDFFPVSSVNHPLPLTTQEETDDRILFSVLAGMFVLIPFCYVPGIFVSFPVKETLIKSKFLQVASGAKLSAFWSSCYLWDVTLYSVLIVLVMSIMLGFKSADVFVGDVQSFFCTAVLFCGYGLSIIPFSYLIARMFT